MRYMEIPIQVEGSGDYVKLETYILDTPVEKIKVKKRPMIIICPGGGYERVSFREGEPIAIHFLNQGYHACILRYSVAPVRYPVSLLEIGSVMKLIHEHAKDWRVDTDKIIVQGSSAGAHLAASLGVFWNQSWLSDTLGVPSEKLRPAGMILNYPVITSEEGIAHSGSFENLLGDKVDELKEKLSLEKHVTKDTPQCFIWHTLDDETVPVENSFLMASALKNAGVPVELHVFPKGIHGLSLADSVNAKADGSCVNEQCAQWVSLADVWFKMIAQQ